MTEKPNRTKMGGPPILGFGFRPFFFLAGVHGAVALLLWLGIQSDSISAPGHWPGATGHGHEMLFGYAPAVLAGLLLTFGVMARVALGHTGRALKLRPSIVTAY